MHVGEKGRKESRDESWQDEKNKKWKFETRALIEKVVAYPSHLFIQWFFNARLVAFEDQFILKIWKSVGFQTKQRPLRLCIEMMHKWLQSKKNYPWKE